MSIVKNCVLGVGSTRNSLRYLLTTTTTTTTTMADTLSLEVDTNNPPPDQTTHCLSLRICHRRQQFLSERLNSNLHMHHCNLHLRLQLQQAQGR